MTAAFALEKFDCLLFDFDGTLVDSSSLHERAFQKVLSAERPDLLAAFTYEKFKGLSTQEAFHAIGIHDKSLALLCTSLKQEYYRAALNRGELTPLPGAVELLESARSGGFRCFLVTSGSNASVTPALTVTGLGRFFSGILTSDDVAQGKPAPDLYQACLRKYEIPVGRAIAIEDAQAGVISAKTAGLPVIGVNNSDIKNEVDLFFPDLYNLAGLLMKSGKSGGER